MGDIKDRGVATMTADVVIRFAVDGSLLFGSSQWLGCKGKGAGARSEGK